MALSEDRPIGVFDSGMGGLTVLAELVRELPAENFVYLGDTARVPYGTKSPNTIQRFSHQIADFLLKKNDIKFLVIACNTASAHAEKILSEKLPVKVVGVIEPGVRALLRESNNARVGVIGTRSTIKSLAYERAIKRHNENVKVFSRACPLFVPIVEEGWMDKKITSLVIQEYLSEMIREDIDTLLLGCTHYPLLKHSIKLEFNGLKLIDSSIETARTVRKQLAGANLERKTSGKGHIRILLTDVTDQIEKLEKLFLGLSFNSIEEIQLIDDE